MIALVLLILALVAFALAALNVSSDKISFVPLGYAFLVGAVLAGWSL